jgi:hypothetical protein
LSDGTTLSRTYTTTNPSFLMPQFSVRAWVVLDGTVGNTYTQNNQHLIAARYGLPGQSLYYDAATVAKITTMETAFGNTLTANGTVAYDGRSNYTSPGDNVHYRWNGSAWVAIAANSGSWIGSITFRSNNTNTIKNGGNITSVTGATAGNYTINFATPMPDTTYAVMITSKRVSNWAGSGDQYGVRNLTSCVVQHVENSVVTDTTDMSVIIIR